MLQGFSDDMVKVIAFCTITKMVFPFICIVFDGPVEEIPGFFDLIPDFWQINKSEWCSMFFDQVFQRNTMESEVAVTQVDGTPYW